MVKSICIELKRQELIDSVLKYGLSADKTLKRSEELDELIFKYQTLHQHDQH
ncbi:sporulation protein Spo0E [Salipaludibacillus keqinensis]|jgi:hypothetical protein|uniref:Sporulation protein Spo0E n=1 Tax=Salipaludibacillus keqinensis TaxID=2045207 RepID=A0A323TIF0_9BACI|nr:aspartyl-phosphate phosphatase Spo0E family protein [Salipaludibacillus keqinensis]PYZ94588.1 sporulation protein Spo0E [Salipaludibacillus keqinensis]